MNQKEILSEIAEKIKENADEILSKNLPIEVTYTNLIGKGYKLYINKDMTLQNTVDLCALCLAVYLQKNQLETK